MTHEVNRLLPKPKKEDQPWRYSMSLCMAAICQEGESHRIITCTDLMASTDYTKAETALKSEPLTRTDLSALFAGDISRAHELLNIYRAYLAKKSEHWSSDALEALRIPPQLLKQRLIGQHVQSHLGMSYKEFLSDESEGLDPAVRSRVSHEIYGITTDVSLIIFGFDTDQHAHLFVFDDETGLREEQAFACIGSGALVAYHALCRREHWQNESVKRTLYNLWEAKKFGELAPTVGKLTFMTLNEPGFTGMEFTKHHRYLSETGRGFLDALYGRFGPKPEITEDELSLPDGMFRPVDEEAEPQQ